MDSKSKAGYSLTLFCQELGVPRKLNFDGSKKQACKGGIFMKEVCRQCIDYNISEPDLHNQNLFEGVIREVRRKWYRNMVKERVPRKLWNYGVSWVSEVMSMTHSSEKSVNGGIPLRNVTGETVDISKYLDFGFYEKFWFKDNSGLSPSEPGRWLGISHQTGRLMCYHILAQTGKVISRSIVQRVTNLKLSTDEVKETFLKFDTEIHRRLKTDSHVY